MLRKNNNFIFILTFVLFLCGCGEDYNTLEEAIIIKYKKSREQSEEIKNIVLTHRISSLSGMDTVGTVFGLELSIEKSMGNEVLLDS